MRYAGGDAAKVGYYDVLALEKAMRAGIRHKRNHAEVVKVTFDPRLVDLRTVLIKFWENHDPTQGDRQGNDVGSIYCSAICYVSEQQKAVALETRDTYQQALERAGFGRITTEIAPLRHYNRAEDYHQDYLKKHPMGYCGLGGTGVPFPGVLPTTMAKSAFEPLDPSVLDNDRQLIVFEAEDCPFCKQFRADVLDGWKSPIPIIATLHPESPKGWTMVKSLFTTPTIVLFEKGREVSRFPGYNGDKYRFWKWLGSQLLTPAQKRIANE